MENIVNATAEVAKWIIVAKNFLAVVSGWTKHSRTIKIRSCKLKV